MIARYVLISAMCVFLMSCAHAKKNVEMEPPANAIAPVDIPSPLVPQVEQEKKPGVEPLQEAISLSLREADVKDVLRGIAKETRYNVVIEPDVEGACTVDLNNVVLCKALEYVLEPLGYMYRIDDRTIYVSKPKLETRIFTINYVALKKVGTSTVIGTIGGSSGGTSGTSSGGTSGGTSGTSGPGEIKAVEVKTDTESDMWKTLEENVKGLLSDEGKKRFAVNKHALKIIVTDYPKYLNSVAMFLKAIENEVHKQVMIEAKIIEVQLNKENREGVNWSLISSRIGDLKFGMSQIFQTQPTVFPQPPTTTTTTTGTSSNAGTPAPNQLFRFFVGTTSGNFDMQNTFIEFLKTQGTVKIVSSPKVATLNNQRAVIKVARQDVYFTQEQSSGTATTTSTTTPVFITVGLILDVTPQIDDSGNIVLNVHPMLTEKVAEVSNPAGGTVPILDVRETDTMVRMREGETVIIGGLIKDTKTSDTTGVPGLMNVPFLGRLFRATDDIVQRNELVVSLTPRIIYDRDVK